jgi:hypothetical protein
MLASVALDGGSAVASIHRSFAFAPRSVRVTYALYAPTTTPYARLGCTVSVNGGNDSSVDVYAQADALFARLAQAVPVDVQDYYLGEVPRAGFTNIEVVLTTEPDPDGGFGAEAVVTRLDTDGVPVATANLGRFSLEQGASTLEVECGVPYADLGNPAVASGSGEVAIDDIAIHGCKH